jgi:hypothetical protein
MFLIMNQLFEYGVFCTNIFKENQYRKIKLNLIVYEKSNIDTNILYFY